MELQKICFFFFLVFILVKGKRETYSLNLACIKKKKNKILNNYDITVIKWYMFSFISAYILLLRALLVYDPKLSGYPPSISNKVRLEWIDSHTKFSLLEFYFNTHYIPWYRYYPTFTISSGYFSVNLTNSMKVWIFFKYFRPDMLCFLSMIVKWKYLVISTASFIQNMFCKSHFRLSSAIGRVYISSLYP